MDQFEAFQYFITNLLLHNLALVVLATLVGVVLGRVMFGTAKGKVDQLREALVKEEKRARAVERELEQFRGRHSELLEKIDEGEPMFSTEQEEELLALREDKGVLGVRMSELAVKLEELLGRLEGLEAEKAGLEAELAKLREGGDGSGAKREVEKMLTTMQALEQRVTEAEDTARGELEGELEKLRGENTRLSKKLAKKKAGSGVGEDVALKKLVEENGRLEAEVVTMRERLEELEGSSKEVRRVKNLPTRRGSKADIEVLEKRAAEAIKEREQVEKASAVLRKEMRGLRNKVKEIEQQEHHESELELALKETEDRLTRSQATIAKEARIKVRLEKMVEDLERKLAEAGVEPERLKDAVDLEESSGELEDAGGGSKGAADALQQGVEDAVETGTKPDIDPEEEPESADEASEEAGALPVEVDAALKEDDFTRIKGIGQILARKLLAGGVTTFRQMADWTDEEMAEFSVKLQLGIRPERGDWRGQARLLCEED